MPGKKKKDFTGLVSKSMRRPDSMADFLSDDEGDQGRAPEKQQPSRPAVKSKPSQKPSPAPDQPAASEESLNLTEQTTFYMDLDICDTLDELWLKLRQKAPKGQKKRISKSLIVNRMVEFCNETLEKEGLDNSKLIKMILGN
jgi:hypothetical protein